MRIGIIGLGYVGLTLAVVASDSGNDVYGVEINQAIKNCLERGEAHFFEPGLNQLIKANMKKTLHSVDAFPEDLPFDVFIVTVGTPLLPGTTEPNMTYIEAAINTIMPVYTGKELVVLRSTVSVGTSRNVVLPLLMQGGKIAESDVRLAMCPERTVEGKAIQELTHLPQIIGALNDESFAIASNFFTTMTPSIVRAQSLEEAEFDKLICNTFRDMTFAISNAFCEIARDYGIDGIRAIEHARKDYERAPIPLPGFVAGPCLEKDAYIMTYDLKESLSKKFILDGRAVNESLEDRVVEWVQVHAKKGDILTLSGMAFKGNPPTNDLRGSSSVRIAKKLVDAGYTLLIHDFVASRQELEDLELGEIVSEIPEAFPESRVLLILNNHEKYGDLDLFGNDSKSDLIVLDVWDCCRDLGNDVTGSVYTIGSMSFADEEK